MGPKTKFKTDYMVLSGLLVATIFWLIDSVLHIFFFNEFDVATSNLLEFAVLC